MATDRLVIKEEVVTYASVLFDAVEPSGQERVLRVYNEIEHIKGLLLSDMELSGALESVDYTPEQRKSLAQAVFSSVDPTLASVLGVMAARLSLKLLPRVFEAYAALVDEKLGLAIVDVTTVVALDDALRNQIREKVEADLGKKVVLRESIDKSILGGVILSTGGKRIDASVATQLGHARQTLKERTNGGESS